MSPKNPRRFACILLCLSSFEARAITLNSTQTDFTTSGNITTSGSGIITSLSGTSDSPNKIKNLHTITTGNSGATSSAYGIRSSGTFYQITNDGTILTSGSSGRGISIAGSSTAINNGTITTQKSSGFGIYGSGSDNIFTNTGTIDASLAYGINSEGDNATINNSGTISGAVYAIRNFGASGTIANSGTLNGGIFLNAGTLNITGGQINGTTLGAAGSVININTDYSQNSDFMGITTLRINSGNDLDSHAKISAEEIFIDANSSLTINSDSTLSGAITGSGTLNILQTSFTANNDIHANIYLDGTLNFNETNNLTIFGNLTGSGSAIVDVGVNQQIISGNFSLLSGDSLKISLAGGSPGKLVVQGLADISANSILEISALNQGYVPDNTKYVIVEGATGSTLSQVSNIFVNGGSNISGLLKFNTQIENDKLVLTINRLAPQDVTADINAQNIYRNLSIIGNQTDGKLMAFQEYLDGGNLSSQEITDSINQLSPQSSKAILAVSSSAVNQAIRIGEKRLDEKLPHGFWTEALRNSAVQNSVKNDEGYKTNSLGLIIGLDRDLSDDAMIGAAVGYVRSDIKSENNLQQNMVSTYQINFYGAKNFDKYFLDGVTSLAWNQYSASRAITALKANASAQYNGYIYSAKIKFGLVEKLQFGFKFIPEFSLNFLHNEISTYEEKGADSLNLKVDSVAANFAEARIGAGLGWVTKIPQPHEFEEFSALLKFSYGHAFINDAPKTRSNFINQNSSFETQINQMDSESLRIGVELNGYYVGDVIFSADYALEKRASFQSHSLWLKAAQKF